MKVIVKIRGGLGNQLFQYAYAKKIAKQYDVDEIILDTSYFNSAHIRGLNIDKYDLSSNVRLNDESDTLFDFFYFVYRAIDRIKYKVSGKHSKSSKVFGKIGYVFCDKTVDKLYAIKENRDIHLAGYFQDEPEIREICSEMNGDFCISEGLSITAKKYEQKLVNNTKTIGVSIRIGKDSKCAEERFNRDFTYKKLIELIID